MANGNDASQTPIVGTAMSNDDVEMLKRFRTSFLPDVKIQEQDTYAKWLFGLTTTIAALGTGFSHVAFAKLSGWGDFFYAAAVLAAGAGLAFALWALSEEVQDANWHSFDAMTEKLSNLANKKKKILWGATFFLFLSFVAAAAAPLATTVELWPSNHSSGITIQISGRALQAGISLRGLRPGAKAKAEVDKEVAGQSELLAAFDQVVDITGVINAKLPEIKLTPEAQSLKLTLSYERGGLLMREEEHFSVPAEPCPEKKELVSGCKNPCKVTQTKKGPTPPKPSLPGCPTR
jgi:hypothetical protein